jgi:hypothetical protein
MSATYDLGDSVKLSFFVKVDTVPTNATVVLLVTKPDGSTTGPSVANPATGTYTAVIAPDQAGGWLYRWTATGAATTAEDGQFLVEPNLAGTLYATVNELRASLADDVRMALDPGQLEQAIRSASRAVDDYCSRPLRRFWLDPTATIRTYRPDHQWCADVDDIGSATGLAVKTDTAGDGTWATTWTIGTDFQLEPLNAAANGGAYAFRKIVAIGSKTFPTLSGSGGQRPTLQVTARHGWSQVPDPVREATLLMAARLYRRKDAPFGVAGFDDFGPVRITRQDSDVVALLAPYAYFGGIA